MPKITREASCDSEMDSLKFDLPSHLIALNPKLDRHTSRLMVIDTKTGKIQHQTFHQLPNHIPKKSVLVLNDTRVLPARLLLNKQVTGGRIAVLVLINEPEKKKDHLTVMLDRKAKYGDVLNHGDRPIFAIKDHLKDSLFLVESMISKGDLLALMDEFGHMPIPHYLRRTQLNQFSLRERYQTIFAKDHSLDIDTNGSPLGSVAAPTASLHLTRSVLQNLSQRDVIIAPITLHVGLGTFSPVTQKNLDQGRLHSEWYRVPSESAQIITSARERGLNIVACGTTAVRAIESWQIRKMTQQASSSANKTYLQTEIFIKPGRKFNCVDMLLTNFHMPGSSLVMLVDAFLQHKRSKMSLKEVYNTAISKGYNFLSFGDAMFIK
jgi:S-adenosylmethionine:tRNA ribosyltransferase-isomerase